MGSLEVRVIVPEYPVARFPDGSLAVRVICMGDPAVTEAGVWEKVKELAWAGVTFNLEVPVRGTPFTRE